MDDYLTVPHDEGVSSHFVHIVRRFGDPEMVIQYFLSRTHNALLQDWVDRANDIVAPQCSDELLVQRGKAQMPRPTIVRDVLQHLAWRIAAKPFMVIKKAEDAAVVTPQPQRIAIAMFSCAGPHVVKEPIGLNSSAVIDPAVSIAVVSRTT
jgi:hypothetical protein